MNPALLEFMASAAYEATRTPSFPAWSEVTPGYRSEMRRSISAAITAALRAGMITVNDGQGTANASRAATGPNSPSSPQPHCDLERITP